MLWLEILLNLPMYLIAWPIGVMFQVSFALLWPSSDPEIHRLQRRAGWLCLLGMSLLVIGGFSLFAGYHALVWLSEGCLGYALLVYSGSLGHQIEVRCKAASASREFNAP